MALSPNKGLHSRKLTRVETSPGGLKGGVAGARTPALAPPVDILQAEPALKKAEPASLAAVPPQPLHTTGLLDSLFEPDDLRLVIGRCYPTLQLRDVLRHDRSDELLRDLAIVISRRNVVTPEE